MKNLWVAYSPARWLNGFLITSRWNSACRLALMWISVHTSPTALTHCEWISVLHWSGVPTAVWPPLPAQPTLQAQTGWITRQAGKYDRTLYKPYTQSVPCDKSDLPASGESTVILHLAVAVLSWCDWDTFACSSAGQQPCREWNNLVLHAKADLAAEKILTM